MVQSQKISVGCGGRLLNIVKKHCLIQLEYNATVYIFKQSAKHSIAHLA